MTAERKCGAVKEKTLYPLWAFLYVLCVVLGAIPERSAAGEAVLRLVALLFFVPGAMLLYRGIRYGRKKTVAAVRWISLASLVLTTAALVANLLSVRAESLTLGDALYVVLSAVSAPMLCLGDQWWAVSLFAWACLLMASFPWVRNLGNKK